MIWLRNDFGKYIWNKNNIYEGFCVNGKKIEIWVILKMIKLLKEFGLMENLRILIFLYFY